MEKINFLSGQAAGVQAVHWLMFSSSNDQFPGAEVAIQMYYNMLTRVHWFHLRLANTMCTCQWSWPAASKQDAVQRNWNPTLCPEEIWFSICSSRIPCCHSGDSVATTSYTDPMCSGYGEASYWYQEQNKYHQLSHSLKKFGQFVGRGNHKSIANAVVENPCLKPEVVEKLAKCIRAYPIVLR